MVGADPFFVSTADFLVQAVGAVPFGVDDDRFPGPPVDPDARLTLSEVRTFSRIGLVHLRRIVGQGPSLCRTILGSRSDCRGQAETPVYGGAPDAWCARCVRDAIAEAREQFEVEVKEGCPLTPAEMRVLLYDPGDVLLTSHLEEVRGRSGADCLNGYPEGCLSSWPLYVFSTLALCPRCARREVEDIRVRVRQRGVDLDREMDNATRLGELPSVDDVAALLSSLAGESM